MQYQSRTSLAAYNSFGIDVSCHALVSVDNPATLVEAIQQARREQLPWLILGGGSNVLFLEDFEGVVCHLNSRGISALEADNDSFLVHIAAGENWHQVVQYCLQQGWYGLENLALIPGSAGAAPVQNIGAYGVELSDRLAYVDVLELDTLTPRRMTPDECRLGYRDSIFKGPLHGRCVITEIGLRLLRDADPVVDYPSLRHHLAQQEQLNAPTPEQVFDAVCDIRRQRLPDPALLGNAGSFFKNPRVSRAHYRRLCRRYPGLPAFELPGAADAVKVPAAWLIEQMGWKGRRIGAVGVHERQALVLVNHGGATGAEIMSLAQKIMQDIEAEFGIALQPEVRIIAAQGERR